MNVTEFISWLKTQPQDAKVEILIQEHHRYCDDYYSTSYYAEFDPNFTGHYIYNKKTNTLTLGGD